MPHLTLLGDADRCMRPELIERSEAILGPDRVRRLAGRGHFLHLEDPELLGSEIAAFIAPS